MEQTLFLKGVALFATMVGLQQWLAQGVSINDIVFIGLVTVFLATLEEDYMKYRKRTEEKKRNGKFADSGAERTVNIEIIGEPTRYNVKLGKALA